MQRENPFPGINPWMQNVWSDLHARLITRIADTLGASLPADLNARAEESVSLEGQGIDDEKGGIRRPDVAIVESEAEAWRGGQAPQWQGPEADKIGIPVLVTQQDVDLTPRWVEIRTADGVPITVIRITSPHNKTARGRDDFERKIDDLLHGGVSVVEIDLVRGGLGARDYRLGQWPGEPAQIVVNRANRKGVAEVYPCPLRQRIPAFRVPLRRGEPDIALDVQPLLNECHRLGRYWQLRYAQPPAGPISDSDLAWAHGSAREAGLIAAE